MGKTKGEHFVYVKVLDEAHDACGAAEYEGAEEDYEEAFEEASAE